MLDKILDFPLRPYVGRIGFAFGIVLTTTAWRSTEPSFLMCAIGGLLIGYGASSGWKD